MKRGKQKDLKHVIYASKPTFFSDTILKKILRSSRKNNVAWGVSGNLICRSDLFFQILEGPPEAIDNLYEKILADNRNLEIQKLRDENTGRRLFASWAMKNDGYQSWMLSRHEINKFNADEALSLFDKLARETDQFVS